MPDAPLSTERFDLWPGDPPGGPPLGEAERKGSARPVVMVYRPPRPDGRAVLSCPGGGYNSVSLANEGSNVARALAPFGITTFALDYRLPVDGWTPRWDAPLQDAQRAMRLIRERSRRYSIDPRRLGVIGFSSGGHLAASLVTGYRDRVYGAVDRADRWTARPAFAALFYAVTTLQVVPPLSQSRRNLLGTEPPPELIRRYSALDRITPRMPPLFLAHASDDPIVPDWMSIDLFKAARAKGNRAELHLFQSGGHGFGATPHPGLPAARWPQLFERWTAGLWT